MDRRLIRYLVRRLLLVPVTLFMILLINFVILNLVPGDPVSSGGINLVGEASRESSGGMADSDMHHLLFREHYGLTRPILFNFWPYTPRRQIEVAIHQLAHPEPGASLYQARSLRREYGDRARFIMPHLVQLATNPEYPIEERIQASSLALRGGLQQGYTGASLSAQQKERNRLVALENQELEKLRILSTDTPTQIEEKITALQEWFSMHIERFTSKNGATVFLETRFARYLYRIFHLDFGSLRNDANTSVWSAVTARMTTSLTLAIVPMLLSASLCLCFGMIMARYHNRWPDHGLNFLFLILFAIPVFVAAPFLIETVALHHTVPFTNLSWPVGGFRSPSPIYQEFTSIRKLGDILVHLLLPLTAILYGSLAIQSRLSRTAFLEVMQQDYVRTAYAKGLPTSTVLIKHVGRNGAITIVTSLAASLGTVLGGALIVETVFDINGFGRFFYDAILNRDYNVVLFSSLAGSTLSVLGYLFADLAYVVLDPRVSLE